MGGWITLTDHVIGSLEPSAADVRTLGAIQGSFLTAAHLKAVLYLVSLMTCSTPHICWGLGCSVHRAVGLSQSGGIGLVFSVNLARRVPGCLVGEPSPSPSRYRPHGPLVQSGSRPLSQGSVSPAVPCVHCCPSRQKGSFLMHLGPRSHLGGQYTQTNQ